MKNQLVCSAVIFALFAQLIGCTVQRTRRLDPRVLQDPQKEVIVGVTTMDGQDVRFDPGGALVARGMVSAYVNRQLYEIPLDQVQRLWVLREEFSTSRTIGLVAAVGAAAAIIAVVATRGEEEEPPPPPPPPGPRSCPFVYSWDGARYVFDAEPYGGAITRGLERDDYSELEHLRAENGFYRLLMTNEAEETQFTNLMELQVVDHPAGTRVVADEWGQFHVVASSQRLSSARDQTGRDLLLWLDSTDRLIWEAPAVADENGNVRHEIVMSFPKPVGATSAMLVANVATGLWGSYMIGTLLELRGRGLQAWYESIDRSQKEAAALLAWNLREELYALKLYVEEPTGWELRGALPGGGPFTAEDRVVILDVSRVPGDELRIRIRPPAGFWALNSFTIDYTTGKVPVVHTVPPLEARDDKGQDLLSPLLRVDDSYYVMPVTGDQAEVTFPAPRQPSGMERTVFLHSRGYYRYHLAGRGEPETEILEAIFNTPDAAARVAAHRFGEWKKASLAETSR